jgi:hypothetical protein
MTTISDLIPRRTLAVLLAVSLSFSSVAFAEPTAADKETAREYMAQGRAARAKNDHDSALAAFKAAHAIMKVPTTGLELGISQMDVGLLLEARETLLAAAKHPESPGEPPKFASARAEAKQLAEGLVVRIPSLHVVFAGVATAEGVSLTIDGLVVPVVSMSVMRKVNPGSHTIVARVNDKERKATAEVKEGESHDVTIDFADPAAPKVVTTAPPKTIADSRAATSPLVYIGFGVAGAGLIAGGITGLMSMSKASSVRDQCVDGKCPPSTHDDYDTGKMLGTVSTVAFVVAGIGATIGVVGLLSKPKVQEGPTVSLFVGPLSTGLMGSF